MLAYIFNDCSLPWLKNDNKSKLNLSLSEMIQARAVPNTINRVFEGLGTELRQLYQDNIKLLKDATPDYINFRAVLFKMSKSYDY